nr:integrase, catalytic region, zinc finger, CCHC-type, peptidase aspartic, catalytic [Tanacetum cinerariifolium]
MFDEHFNPSNIIASLVSVATTLRAVDLTDSPVSTLINQDAPSINIPSTQEQEHSLIISQGFEESPKKLHFHDDLLYESLYEDSTSQGSSSNVRPIHTLFESLGRCTKDYPIANVIRDPSCFVFMRKQLKIDAILCYFDAFLSSVEPKNFKQVMTKPSWIDAMQEEIHEFERLQVWELVPCRDKVKLIKLKWIYKVKTDEFGGVLNNKARLVAQGFRPEEGFNFKESFTPVARIEAIAEPPKPKKIQKKPDSTISSEETSSKKKPSKAKKDVTSTKKPASKPKSTKKKASVKADRGKSGSGDGTDFESGFPDEQQRKISGTDERTGAKLKVPDVPKYYSKSDKESWGDSREEDDDDDDTKDDDDNDGNDDDDDNDGNDDDDSDHERTKSDTNENSNLNQSNIKDKEEEEYADKFTNKEDDADNAKDENEEELDDVEEL